MKQVVKSIKYNWYSVGSLVHKDGAGEDWHSFELNKNGVTSIKEEPPACEGDRWSYVVYVDHAIKYRIFNPNFVEYDLI